MHERVCVCPRIIYAVESQVCLHSRSMGMCLFYEFSKSKVFLSKDVLRFVLGQFYILNIIYMFYRFQGQCYNWEITKCVIHV